MLLFTYPVFLLASVLCLADADTVARVAHGLVGALPDWLSAQVGKVAAHLWRHRCQSWHRRPPSAYLERRKLQLWLHRLRLIQLILIELKLRTTQGSDRQLKRVTSCLRDLLGHARLLIGAVRRRRLKDQRGKQAGLRIFEARLETETRACLLSLIQATLFTEA